MLDRILNTPLIFKLLRETLTKFVSCKNKLLAKSFLPEKFARFVTLMCLC